jgi:hypothetical protein
MSSSVSQFWGKEKPTARSLLAVGSGDSLKIALLHPIPSSRRHVIRVDIPVPVDVIRVDFWMRVVMKIFDAGDNYKLRVVPRPGPGEIQNSDRCHRYFR